MSGPAPGNLPSGELVASVLGRTWARLASTLPAGWARETDGVIALLTGVQDSTSNGVWAIGPDVDGAAVEDGLEAVTEHRVPFCLQTRPGWHDDAAIVAAAHGMGRAPDIPVMASASPVIAAPADRLRIRRLGADEAPLHCEVAGLAFAVPPAMFSGLVNEKLLALAEVRGYLGHVDGQPVATAMAVKIEDAVGVFNVATVPEHQRRGYGAAITAQAVSEAFDAGATWAWLQSTEAGYQLYERLGFGTVERWSCWVSEG